MPYDIQLKHDNVDVWCISLHMDGSSLDLLRKFLSEDERIKADRLKFKRVRDQRVAARGLLRLILAAYLNEQPNDLEFQYSQRGKPALAYELSHTGITFNMSHSHDMALYCVGLERELGADIEKVRSDMSFERIAKRFFTSLEYETLIKLPGTELKYGFFNCWTRKEAYIKAKGEGLYLP